MPIAKQTSGNFEPAPAGTHIARCIACIALGTQPQNNSQFPPSFKVMLTWELPNEAIQVEGGSKPMVVSKEYTLSLSEKSNLYADLISWRGREFTSKELEGFEVSNGVGVPCMITIVHKTTAKKSVYANVSSVSGMPKGSQCAPAVHPLVKYEITQGKDSSFTAMPEWIQKKIAQCFEWTKPAQQEEGYQEGAEAGLEQPVAEGDDVPF